MTNKYHDTAVLICARAMAGHKDAFAKHPVWSLLDKFGIGYAYGRAAEEAIYAAGVLDRGSRRSAIEDAVISLSFGLAWELYGRGAYYCVDHAQAVENFCSCVLRAAIRAKGISDASVDFANAGEIIWVSMKTDVMARLIAWLVQDAMDVAPAAELQQ